MTRKDFLLRLDHLLRLPAGTINGSEPLKDLKGWDSMAAVEFIAVADELFQLPISGRQLADCRTTADLAGLVACRLVDSV